MFSSITKSSRRATYEPGPRCVTRLVLSPGQVIAGVLGLVTAVMGIMALSRGGIDGSMNVPHGAHRQPRPKRVLRGQRARCRIAPDSRRVIRCQSIL